MPIIPDNEMCMFSSNVFLITEFSVCTQSQWRRQWQPTPVLLLGEFHGCRSLVGYSPWGREELDTTEWLHFHFHALKKEMATHSSVLACRIPGMEDPGGLPSMGSHRVGHKWRDLASAAHRGRCCKSIYQHCHLCPVDCSVFFKKRA